MRDWVPLDFSVWMGKNQNKSTEHLKPFWFEGLVAKFRRAWQCDRLSEPDIRPPDLEFSGTSATEIAHFRLI